MKRGLGAKTIGRAAVLMLVWTPAGGPALAQTPPVNPQAQALKEFNDRVERYVELHRRLEADPAPLSSNPEPEQVQEHRRALAAAIRRARPTAKRGDIFTDRVVPLFRQVIRRDLQKRQKSDAYATLEGVPRAGVLRVNGDYPEGAPLATVPPLLLNSLQRLPEELEYRFLGRALILRDLHANLIVDYIEKALPRRP